MEQADKIVESPFEGNLYSYVSNSPVNFIDPSGLFLGALLGAVGDVIDTTIKVTTGITLAHFSTSIALQDFSLGVVRYVLGGEAPGLEYFDGSLTSSNSVLANALDVSTTWGPTIFLQTGADDETWRHEFGHTRQFYKYGGIGYLSQGIQNGGEHSFFEFEADLMAKQYFNQKTCDYEAPNHIIPECR